MEYVDVKKIAYDVCKPLPNGEQKDIVVYYAIQTAMTAAKQEAKNSNFLQQEQPKSGCSEKPNNHKEWSEDDKDTYKSVYCLFRDALDEWYECVFAGCYPKITKKKVLAMLKSLRPQPHWKPSEEQMDALDNIAGVFSPDNKEYKMVMHHINTLRNKLKQL